MLIRRETHADHAAIRAVHARAFAQGDQSEPAEARLVDELRADSGWIPELSFVAVDRPTTSDGGLVGHVVCTRAAVGKSPALGLGPLGVHPDRQRAGIGAALMHAVLAAADALGEPVVVLLGHIGYYSRFGFRPASEIGIFAPDPQWGDHFQARPLTMYRPSIQGPFTYAEPFSRL